MGRNRRGVVMSRAEQYRRLARDFHFMARGVPPGENRSVLLNMAEECDRLAEQQERATDPRQEISRMRAMERPCQAPPRSHKTSTASPSTIARTCHGHTARL